MCLPPWSPEKRTIGALDTLAAQCEHCVRVLCQVLRRAFRYHWRLWTLPEVREMLTAAGFDDVRLAHASPHSFLALPKRGVLVISTTCHICQSAAGHTDMLHLFFDAAVQCSGSAYQHINGHVAA